MSSLGISALIVAACWLALLTVTVLAVIRQVAVMMLRLDQGLPGADGVAPVDDGITVGRPLPSLVATLIGEGSESLSFVVVLAAVCNPCRELAPRLDEVRTTVPMTVLIAGADEGLVTDLTRLLPGGVNTVSGSRGNAAISALEIRTTPFVFEFRAGRLAAKAAIRDLDFLKQFIGEAESLGASEYRPAMVEVAS